MSEFTIGPPPSAETQDALLSSVQPPERRRLGDRLMFISAKSLMLPVFDRAELEKLGSSQDLVDLGGNRHRTLESWLVPGTEVADRPDDAEAIQVRVRTQGLVVTVPRRAFGEDAPHLLAVRPDEGEATAEVSVDSDVLAELLLTPEEPGEPEERMPLAADLDVAAARLRMELSYPTPRARVRIMEAVHDGRARIVVKGRHVMMLRRNNGSGPGGGGGPVVLTPLGVRPLEVLERVRVRLPPGALARPGAGAVVAPGTRPGAGGPGPRPGGRGPVPGLRRGLPGVGPGAPPGAPVVMAEAAEPVAARLRLDSASGRRLAVMDRLTRIFEKPKLVLGNTSTLDVAAGGSATLPFDVAGPSACRARLSWGEAATLRARIVGPDGRWRVLAEGRERLDLSLQLTPGELEAGQNGWRLELTSVEGGRARVKVVHSLPRWKPVLKPRRVEVLGGVVHVLEGLVAHGGAPATLERMPDARSTVVLRGEKRALRTITGPSPKDVVEARVTWPGGARLGASLLGEGDAVLAMAEGTARAEVQVARGGSGPWQLVLTNPERARVTCQVAHSPGQLTDAPTGPMVDGALDPDTTHVHRVTYEVPLAVSRVTRPWAWPDLETDTRWHEARVRVGGPGEEASVHFRVSDDTIGQYFYLPQAFRLGFMAASGLPAVLPSMYLREGAPDPPEPEDWRISCTLVAVPWLDPARREALRDHLVATRDLPFAEVDPAEGVGARFVPLDGGDAEGTSVTVYPSRGFVLPLDMPAWRYALLAERLRSPQGLAGTVWLKLGEDDERPVDVQLSLQRVATWAVRATVATRNRDERVELENLTAGERVRVEGLRAWRVLRGDLGVLATASVSVPSEPVELAPGATLTLQPEPALEVEDHELEVALDACTVLGVDADAWLDRVNRAGATRPPIAVKVQVVGLDDPALASAGATGMQVALLGPDGSLSGQALVTADAPRWETTVAHDLAAYAAGAAGLRGAVLEARVVYADRDGRRQRVPVAGAVPVLRPPGPEGEGWRYRVEVLEADGDALREEVVPAAEVDAVLAALADEGAFWRLRTELAAEPEGPDGPDGPDGPEGPDGPDGPEEPDGSEEPDGPEGPDGPADAAPIDVSLALLDFTGPLDRVFLTLRPDDPAAGSTTLVLGAESADPARWTPASGRATPCAWEATYILTDGPARTASGRAEDGLLVLELPSPGG